MRCHCNVRFTYALRYMWPIHTHRYETPEDMHLVVEYQTLHRLPDTHALVFGIHKYIDPLSSLVHAPHAADMMVRSWDAKSPQQMEYMIGSDVAKRNEIVDYVRGIAEFGRVLMAEKQRVLAAGSSASHARL